MNRPTSKRLKDDILRLYLNTHKKNSKDPAKVKEKVRRNHLPSKWYPLADEAIDQGYVWYSKDTLADMLGCSARQAVAARKSLVEDGYLAPFKTKIQYGVWLKPTEKALKDRQWKPSLGDKVSPKVSDRMSSTSESVSPSLGDKVSPSLGDSVNESSEDIAPVSPEAVSPYMDNTLDNRKTSPTEKSSVRTIGLTSSSEVNTEDLIDHEGSTNEGDHCTHSGDSGVLPQLVAASAPKEGSEEIPPARKQSPTTSNPSKLTTRKPYAPVKRVRKSRQFTTDSPARDLLFPVEEPLPRRGFRKFTGQQDEVNGVTCAFTTTGHPIPVNDLTSCESDQFQAAWFTYHQALALHGSR